MLSERFQDFDACVERIRDVDTIMTFKNLARRSWEIEVAEVGGICVQQGRFGSGNIVEGKSSDDGYMVYLQLSEDPRHSANGTVIPKDGFMILGPGSEFFLSGECEHDWCTIFIPRSTLDVDSALEATEGVSEKMICRVTRSNPRHAGRLRRYVGEILGAAVSYPEFESSPAAVVASARLLKLGRSILGCAPVHDSAQGGRPKVPRDEIVRRAQALLEERAQDRVPISYLARVAEVSERTLRTAFEEVCGVGPTRYLQLRNLHGVHRTLRAADPEETTIAQVLGSHGEWEFSRFAARYRRLFGELPSETLRAKRR